MNLFWLQKYMCSYVHSIKFYISWFLRSDEGGRILIVSFYECPEYVFAGIGCDPRGCDAMRFQSLDAILDWLADGITMTTNKVF